MHAGAWSGLCGVQLYLHRKEYLGVDHRSGAAGCHLKLLGHLQAALHCPLLRLRQETVETFCLAEEGLCCHSQHASAGQACPSLYK